MPQLRLGRRRQSLAGRVAAIAAAAVGLSVTVLSVAAYFTVRHQTYATMDKSLMSRAVVSARNDIATDLTNNQVPSWMVAAANVQIALVTSTGQIVSADHKSSGIAAWLGAAELAVARGQSADSIRTAETPSGQFRVVAVPTGTTGQGLVIAQSLTPTEQTLHDLGLVMLLLGALGVVFAAGAGSLVARNGLRPVRTLTDAIEKVARTEELTPIEMSGSDELGRLAAAFNAMISSLSASRDLQAQLVTDASHELRTPLTSLRTNLDLLHQAEVGEGLGRRARQELLDDVSLQITELTELIASLAELARGDSLYGSEQRVEMQEVLDRAVERAQRNAPDLAFEVSGEEWSVVGEASALERAVGNLLENAVTWSPTRGTVRVSLTRGVLTVEDEGPGVAAEDVPYVFDRFYRARESRALPGSGLGLSVVKHVVERHGGEVSVASSRFGGAAFSIQLPASAASSLTGEGSRAHSGRSATRDNVET